MAKRTPARNEILGDASETIDDLSLDIEPYKGVLDPRILGHLKPAYTAFSNQITKCYKADSQDFRYYGAKGIKVRYDSRTLVSWYAHHIKHFKGKKPSVGRIDHNGDYCLSNIILQDHSENCGERYHRVGRPGPSEVPLVLIGQQDQPLMIFKNASYCASIFKVNIQGLIALAKRRGTSRKGLKFRFLSDYPVHFEKWSLGLRP